jgi:hypothetical protein
MFKYARLGPQSPHTGTLFILSFIIAGVWITNGTNACQMVSMFPPNLAQTSVDKVVEKATGAWMSNYNSHLVLWLFSLWLSLERCSVSLLHREKWRPGLRCEFRDVDWRHFYGGHCNVPVYDVFQFRSTQ